MPDTEIGYIDYSEMNVDKNVSYDSLKDRVVVITGAGQAIGRGYAHYFSAQGAIPVIADINGDKAEGVKREIEEKQGKALAVTVDVADEASTISMIDKAMSEFGPRLMALATVTAAAPLGLGYLLGRRLFGLDPLETLGAVCGGITSTPGLGAITSATDSQVPVASYAAAYPAALILMTVVARALVNLLGG